MSQASDSRRSRRGRRRQRRDRRPRAQCAPSRARAHGRARAAAPPSDRLSRRAAAEATPARRGAGADVRLSAAEARRLLSPARRRSRSGDARAGQSAAAGRSSNMSTEISPGAIAEALRAHGRERGCDRASFRSITPASPRRSRRWRARGKPTFALLSDLTAEARAGYVGRDNRKRGTHRRLADRQGRAARPGKIGIIVGSHRYLCQETAEISFRAYLRENAAAFHGAGAAGQSRGCPPRPCGDAGTDRAPAPISSGSTSAAAAWRASIAAARDEAGHEPRDRLQRIDRRKRAPD